MQYSINTCYTFSKYCNDPNVVNCPNIVNDPNVFKDPNIVNSSNVVNCPYINERNVLNCPTVVIKKKTKTNKKTPHFRNNSKINY